jgi:adenosylhomocysteine nucleosidase
MTIDTTEVQLGREVHLGSLEGKEIVLGEAGVGMTSAAMTAQRMIDVYNPRLVLLTGIAGGIDSTVNVGDIAVPQKWIQHDYGYFGKDGLEFWPICIYLPDDDSMSHVSSFTVDDELLTVAEQVDIAELKLDSLGNRIPRLLIGGTGVSGNTFIDSREKRSWLFSQFDAKVVDMESAAVVQVCIVNDIPVLIFRSASDLAGGSGSETAREEIEQFFEIAASNSAKVLIATLKKLE